MKVCIVGASGKLGQYLAQHALDRGYEVVGVCREQSVAKLDALTRRITVIPGAADDCEVIRKAVAGCDGALRLVVKGFKPSPITIARTATDSAPAHHDVTA